MPKTIAIVGALDTKGDEFAFVKSEIEQRGRGTLVIDTGVIGASAFEPDVSRDMVAEAAGTTLDALKAGNDRGAAIDAMAAGVAVIVQGLYEAGALDAVVSMGGSAGTAVGTSAMRALPVGVPKVMVSTVAAGDTTNYVGIKDVVMIPSVVDVSGINRISRRIFANAVGAIVGMVETAGKVESGVREAADKPLVAASMFGNTTEAVDRARSIMEAAGYEVLVFHCTGAGGRTMEGLVDEGLIEGVLDVTTTEWADELAGGVLSAGPERMDAAGRAGIPQVIAPGCLDMVNFWAPDTVPPRYRDRKLHQWNPNITLMRTNVDENARLGEIVAKKANASGGPVSVFLPLRGVSVLDSPGNDFWWPEADQALFDAIRAHVSDHVRVTEMDCNINDPAFAQAVADRLLDDLEDRPPCR